MVETGTTQRNLPVVGVCTDYMLGGTSLYLDRAEAKSLLGIEGSDGLLIRLDQPENPKTLERLQTLTNENGLLMQSYSDFMGLIDQMMNGANAMIWGVLILDFLVAGLAIANTLSMNVLEQTRELGLMRAGGMTRSQVQRLVVFQALLMALVGLPLGAAAGLLLAWVISLVLLPLIGHAVPFDLRLPLLAACSATALLIVLAASWLPARRAARTPAIEAIHTE
jgi:putative ABC transport system permease protein